MSTAVRGLCADVHPWTAQRGGNMTEKDLCRAQIARPVQHRCGAPLPNAPELRGVRPHDALGRVFDEFIQL